jgi:hypothetical protein
MDEYDRMYCMYAGNPPIQKFVSVDLVEDEDEDMLVKFTVDTRPFTTFCILDWSHPAYDNGCNCKTCWRSKMIRHYTFHSLKQGKKFDAVYFRVLGKYHDEALEMCCF